MRIDKERKNKLLKDISDIAQYYRQTRQTQRINLVISVLYNLLILLFIVGTIMSVIKSGSFGALFGDQQDLKRRFDCQSGDIKDVVKSYEEANNFVNMYKGTCRLYHQVVDNG